MTTTRGAAQTNMDCSCAGLTDAQYELADRIEAALETAERLHGHVRGRSGLTPSQVARKTRATTNEAYDVLRYMVDHQYVHTSGNGAWTHYHAGRR